MNTLILYAHPNADSFNQGLLQTVTRTLEADGHDYRVRDLYQLGFKSELDAADFELINEGKMPDDIAEEQTHVEWAEALVLIYPTWWFGPPAILKGWVDRVFQNGFAFDYLDDGSVKGRLGGRRALVLQTTGADEKTHVDMNAVGLITQPMSEGSLHFCGIEPVEHRVYYAVPVISNEARVAMLDDAADSLRQLLKA